MPAAAQAILPAPHAALPLRALEETAGLGFSLLFEHAVALQMKGYPERALPVLEKAVAAEPGNVDGLCAYARLLLALQRPKAAYAFLDERREPLSRTAEGWATLAEAAAAVRRHDEAISLFSQALTLDPDNLTALTQLARHDASLGLHDSAIERTRRCAELRPDLPALRANHIDCLIGARRHAEALRRLDLALARFPGDHAFVARRALMLAYTGDFAGAEAAFAALRPEARDFVLRLISQASPAVATAVRYGQGAIPSPAELFTQQAFDAMRQADWRGEAQTTGVLRKLLAEAERTGAAPDWRDAQFYTLLLPMTEDEQLRIRNVTAATVRRRVERMELPPTGKLPPRTGDARIHVGISVQDLTQGRHGGALREQLRMHDRDRFAFHLYSRVPALDGAAAKSFEGLVEGFVEIGHMLPTEAVMRMRLDRLDVWVDTTYFTPACSLEIPALRVAPVQMRHQTWQRAHLPRPCDYSVGDLFTHPGPPDPRLGAIVRLPSTCWLATDLVEPATAGAEPGALAQARLANGLPENALVLCAFVPTVTIDLETFAAWMRILQSLPHAVLWLAPADATTRANLAREAEAAGVAPARLLHAAKGSRLEMLARMPLADLFLDTLRFNACQALPDVLRAGLPAITRAGANMASRLGGSIIGAAGLPECVAPDTRSYIDLAVRLGREPAYLAALRAKLRAAHRTAPLFDMAARVREWEAAWTLMVERHRAGLPPAAFDVAPARPTLSSPPTTPA